MRRPTKEDNEAMGILVNPRNNLTVWEEDFLFELEERAGEELFWSEKQGVKFDEIWERVMG